jgi:hypothetical protein
VDLLGKAVDQNLAGQGVDLFVMGHGADLLVKSSGSGPTCNGPGMWNYLQWARVRINFSDPGCGTAFTIMCQWQTL